MIACIEGDLINVLSDGSVLVRVGPITYSILVPAYDRERFIGLVGQQITLHTLHYFESIGQGNVFLPRLIGFESPDARSFFELFTTVKGIGNRKALRALAVPIGTVAHAIANRDAKFLTTLPEIGKRTADTIVAELHGKVDAFVGSADQIETSGSSVGWSGIEPVQRESAEEALAVLIQLGETRQQAMKWIEQVIMSDSEGESQDAEAIVSAVYRARGG